MADQNVGEPSPSAEENSSENGKPVIDMSIVGYNVLALAVYTIISGLIKDVGPFLDALLLFFHVLTCFILAIAYRKWVWALSGLAVLLIGVSTCVGILFR
jgi:hypothetical protein